MIPVSPWPLRYRISKLEQLKDATSNNSRDLHISVTKFLNEERISGLRVQVIHDQFGPLFCTVVGADGTLVSCMPSGYPFEMTIGQILEELAKWGFIIDYNPARTVPSDQLTFLMTLRELWFDKIRIMSVYSYVNALKQFKWYVVAFKVDALGDWMNAGYSVSEKEFNDALNKGIAMNISALSEAQGYDWNWLYGWVGDIDDILKDNA